jgi:hypothetical protein
MRAWWKLPAACAAIGGAVVAGSVACGGGAGAAPSSPPCDQACQDAVAVQSLRDAIKLAYNLGLQGQPVGAQDASAPCPLGGSAHVFGEATSNAAVGSTSVALTYAFDQCGFSNTDTDPKRTYAVTLNGAITENGTLAQQPSATTALDLASDAMSFAGTVYTPPIPYDAGPCAMQLGQNGNQLSGTMCGRQVGLTL